MDRTTKLLLAAIALGLWANAGVTRAHSGDYDYIEINELRVQVQSLEDKVRALQDRTEAVERKVCGNGLPSIRSACS